jgi:hypothetical protein
MEKHISANYIKASNLIFLTAGLVLVSLFILSDDYPFGMNIYAVLIDVFFFGGMGILVRRGVKWIKYVLLLLIIIILFGVPSTIKSNTLFAILILFIQTFTQIWAVILLFKKNKTDMVEDTVLE